MGGASLNTRNIPEASVDFKKISKNVPPGPGWITTVVGHMGSKPGHGTEYRRNARRIIELIAKGTGIKNFVYGGGQSGTMGVTGKAAVDFGLGVYDVTLRFFHAAQGDALAGIKQSIVVDTMHERMREMRVLGQSQFALPGSFGTLEEGFEWVTSRNGIVKPQFYLNQKGYYNHLRRFMKDSAQAGFRHPEDAQRVYFVKTPEEFVTKLNELNAKPAIIEPEETLIEGDWHDYVEETDHAYIVTRPAPLTVVGKILTRMVEYDVSNIDGQTLFNEPIIRPFIFGHPIYKSLTDQFSVAIKEGFLYPERRMFYAFASSMKWAREKAKIIDDREPITPALLKKKHAEAGRLPSVSEAQKPVFAMA